MKTAVNRAGRRIAWRATCPVCGGAFFAKRSDAVTCSNACRQKLYRKRQRAARARHRQKCKQLALPMPETGWQVAQRYYEL